MVMQMCYGMVAFSNEQIETPLALMRCIDWQLDAILDAQCIVYIYFSYCLL